MKKIIHFTLISCLLMIIVVGNTYGEDIQDIIQSADDSVSEPESMFGISEETSTSDIKLPEKNDDSQLKNNLYYSIQFGIFLKEEEANNQIIRLKDMGHNPYIFQSINSHNQTVYAVRLGRYSSIESAVEASISFESKTNQPVLVTNYDSLKPASTTTIPPSRVQTDTSRSAGASGDDNILNSSESNLVVHNDSGFNDSASFQILLKKVEDLEEQINEINGESEVRRHLQSSEEEESSIKKEQADILEDVDRRYTLRPVGQVELNVGFSYAHSTYDAIRAGSTVEDVANHTINTSLGAQYGLKENITVGFDIPFKYKYHQVGTIQSKEATGLGDLRLSWQFQPTTTNSNLPTIIINGNFSVPVGTSPYEIQYGEELSTSSGVITTGIGASISKVTDPVVLFSSVSATYPFTVTDINQKRDEGTLDEVDQGVGLGLGFGFGAAISSEVNFNMSFGYSYSFETKYKYKDAPTSKTGIGAGASLSMGLGYKYYKNYKTNFNIRFPLTSTGSYSLSFSTPIRFNTQL